MQEQFIVVDIETTGLCAPTSYKNNLSCVASYQHGKANFDEILQLAIINQNGQTLFYDSFKPERKTSWPKAQSVHHIVPEDVAAKLSFTKSAEKINAIIASAPLIIAYNAVFDLSFLHGCNINLLHKPYICAMKTFSRAFKSTKWKSLANCAAYFNLKNSKEHDALGDAQLTLACVRAMSADKRFHLQSEIWGE
jgi:DNA polymerase III epsilon subunit-like protein